MSYSNRVVEGSTLEGSIVTTGATGTFTSNAIDLSVARRHLVQWSVPTLAGGATVTGSVLWCATTGGSYTAITGSGFATESTGGKVFVSELTNEAIVQLQPTAKFIKVQIVVATAAASASATCRGFIPSFLPTTDTATGAQAPNVTVS